MSIFASEARAIDTRPLFCHLIENPAEKNYYFMTLGTLIIACTTDGGFVEYGPMI